MRDLSNVTHLFQQALEPLPLAPVERNRVLEPCHLESQTGGLDLGTAEGQFLLGLWCGNQILASLYAPVKVER